ncbi:type I methionyl aminopeptidase [bacterium]|nr:type I methionyl aminopeptidase [bacterium]|tara:strand:- start:163 stop:936 length:774 start_codon:yes stop_codon:yes gene_type:complete
MSITLKTEEDIKILRTGGKLLASILNELEKLVVAGNTSLDVDDTAMELLEQNNLEPLTLGYQPTFAERPYPAAVCVSINDEIVHGIPNETPKEFVDGDVVSIDLVIGYKGMVLDSARTVGVGEIDNQASQLLDVTKKALQAGIKAAKPGNRIVDIGAAIEDSVPEGFAIVRDFCGHGVGYELHEEPQIPNFRTKGESVLIETGMVLAIEPMIIAGNDPDVVIDRDGYTALTASGQNSAHMEHTVLVTDKGPEILTIA